MFSSFLNSTCTYLLMSIHSTYINNGEFRTGSTMSTIFIITQREHKIYHTFNSQIVWMCKLLLTGRCWRNSFCKHRYKNVINEVFTVIASALLNLWLEFWNWRLTIIYLIEIDFDKCFVETLIWFLHKDFRWKIYWVIKNISDKSFFLWIIRSYLYSTIGAIVYSMSV